MKKKDKNEMEEEVTDRLKDYSKCMLASSPEFFEKEVAAKKEAVMNLARYYQMQQDLKTKQAVKLAVKHLITDLHIKPFKDLMMPSKIIDDGNSNRYR